MAKDPEGDPISARRDSKEHEKAAAAPSKDPRSGDALRSDRGMVHPNVGSRTLVQDVNIDVNIVPYYVSIANNSSSRRTENKTTENPIRAKLTVCV